MVDRNYNAGRRQRSGAAGWIIGIIAVALLIWVGFAIFDNEEGVDDLAGTGELPEETIVTENEVAETGVGDEELAETDVGETPTAGSGPITITEETDLEANASQYYGQQVIVIGEVNEILSDNAFRVDYDGALGGDELLVFLPAGQQLTAEQGTKVQVNGTMRQLIIADIEQDLGYDLDDTLYIEYQDKPIVVAESVSVETAPEAS